MKTLIIRAAATVLAAGLLTAGASAAPMKMAKSAAKTLSCPACHMPMPMKKSAAYPVPEKINGKTYYCCDKCPIGKKTMAAMKSAKMKSTKKM